MLKALCKTISQQNYKKVINMRKFNKRILSLFLSTAMLVSLVACNKTKGNETKSGKKAKRNKNPLSDWKL